MYGKQTVNHQALMAAQSKAVIARFLGDAGMWLQANQQMKQAVSMPWYRRTQ
ncbi:host cell division inhibitory peptide Kil [Cronobacter sakazakii]|uniref:host cell division inhibitory peptide Kil n=1 Tax=Cronobacter sakazakii TaxID=28141 RepID=UPI000948B5F9|nr:host cell division inhibitory peptide Kil [Cronobacter sakazakii]ELY2556072.1 host cell division inhibitory peptide Kil [Cronobacter sakazakii]ELY2692828.1 host cell division inhibitory peptide Kil [Cronobacter sakazakii]ELY2913995.1 host cell division inhibitory peptide Kil [Cronobacter sakazakii]ELY3386549.1 host cell division inhibitory peptide Kil [Cronobacter sakazakii]ELY4205772.1 host cell division inhibitory peptide Kil [Cronobacter sakazakii]